MNGKFTRPSLIVIDGVSQPEVPSRLEPKGLINCLSGASHDPLGASSFIQPLELPPCRSVPLWKADRFNTDKAKQDALQMGNSRGDNHRAPHILSLMTWSGGGARSLTLSPLCQRGTAPRRGQGRHGRRPEWSRAGSPRRYCCWSHGTTNPGRQMPTTAPSQRARVSGLVWAAGGHC